MSVKRKEVIFYFLVAIIVPLLLSSSNACAFEGQRSIKLKVFNAGSLMVPFKEIEKEFESGHPDVDVLIEGHGSVQVIRQITDLHDTVDVAAVADHSLIPAMMYNAQMPDNRGPYADWYVVFARNKLGIAYTPQSQYSSEIDAQNWCTILSRPDVKLGISDPRFDSLGYRALMCVQLAQDYYGDSAIFQKLIGDNFGKSLSVSATDGSYVVSVSEIVKPVNNKVVMRPYSIQTLALLQSHDIDYAFEYESVAKQNGLNFLELPAEISLSSDEFADSYSHVRVKLDFQRFASVAPDFEGQPILYGVTIPRNAQNPNEAIQFLLFLLGPEGQRILAASYQPGITPPIAYNKAQVPPEIAALVQ